jgi:cystathionine gamma-synthase
VKPETLAIKLGHTGVDVAPPIHLSTTYVRDEHYALEGNRDYSRDKNPTFDHAEEVLAALEGGAAALTFASGMAAATTALRTLATPGGHVVASRVGYYAVRGWLQKFCAKWQVALDLVDTSDAAQVAAAMRPGQTRVVWFETPANPTWEVTDIAAIAAIAKRAGARTVVDSTAASPVFTRPLALGADLVMHSATKYLGGHSDVVAGALVTAARDELWAELELARREEGAILGPVESYLLLRGMRTLFARVPRQAATALALAQKIETLGVAVHYPGLRGHPQHAVAARQMTGGFGGMLSIRVGDRDPLAVIRKLRVWVPATSLGGVESLVEHRYSVEGPTTPTPKDLLRLSVGLEHEDDLYDDLARAL